VSNRPSEPQPTAGGTAADVELTAGLTATLIALWGLRDAFYVTAADVHRRAREQGRARSLTTIRRDLETLVKLDYAERHSVRYTNRPRRVHYWATRRPGERIPPACVRSDFVRWLWDARLSYERWCFSLTRWVTVDRLSRRATAEEWAWLSTRPIFAPDGEPTPDDPAWWEDPPSAESDEASDNA
jgi:hypothetical protein